jgi:small ligand-binding sensory domain FIST
VQFHLRDARTSAEDLEAMLGHRAGAPAPAGALLFSCLGRGMHLYGRADHDTGAFRRHLGEVALGGFFCNGEIGPVEGATFLHGYTSAFGLFRPQRRH